MSWCFSIAQPLWHRLVRRVGDHAFHRACGGVVVLRLSRERSTGQKNGDIKRGGELRLHHLFRLVLQLEGYFHALLILDADALPLAW